MADSEILDINFNVDPAKKSLENLVKHVVKVQKKFESIKIKFQVDQKSWDKAKTNLENKASKLKDVIVKLKLAPATKESINEAKIATNKALKEIKLNPIPIKLGPAEEKDIKQAIAGTNAKLATKKFLPVKVDLDLTKGMINSFLAQLKRAVGAAKSNNIPITLSISKGRGKQNLAGATADFNAASTAKDKFYQNVRTVFPQLEKYFRDLGIAANIATKSLVDFFKNNNKQLNSLKGTVKALAKLSTLRVNTAPKTQSWSQYLSKLQEVGNRFRLFAFDFYIFGQALLHGVVNPIGQSIKVFRLFEQNMKNAQVLSGATDAQFRKVEQTLTKLSSATRYTKTDLSELVDEFARAGLKAGAIEQSLKSVVDLADAVGKAGVSNSENLKNSYNILTDAYFGFKKQYEGLSQEDAFKSISNSIAAAANASKADLQDFGYFMNQVVASAVQANLKLDDTVALFATLKQVMPSGRMASSALNQAIVQLSTFPSEKEFDGVIDRLKVIGLTADDINPSIVDLKTAIDNIFKINPTQNEIFKIFGTEGSRVPSLIRNLGDEFERISREITTYKNSLADTNSVEKIAARTRETANYSIEKLISNFENLKIEIGKVASELLVHYSAGLIHTIKSVVLWIREHKALVFNILKVTAFVVILTGSLYTLGLAGQGVIKIWASFKLMSKVVAVALGVLTGSTLKAAMAAAVANTAYSGWAAVITAGAIIAGITAIVVAFGKLNRKIQEGINITPNYLDKMQAQKDEYSDNTIRVNTYVEALQAQIDAEKELLALKHSARTLTPEQEKRKSDLESGSLSDEDIKNKIKEVNKIISDLDVEIKKATNSISKESLEGRRLDLKDKQVELERLLDKDALQADIMQEAANKYIQTIQRIQALNEKFKKDGTLPITEMKEYNDLLDQANTIGKNFDTTSFRSEIQKQADQLENSAQQVANFKTFLEEALKLARSPGTGEISKFDVQLKQIDLSSMINKAMKDGALDQFPGLEARLEKFKDIGQFTDKGFGDVDAYREQVKAIENIFNSVDLSIFNEKFGETLTLVSLFKEAIPSLKDIDISADIGANLLTTQNQEALASWQTRTKEINEIIEDGINYSLEDTTKQTKQINKEHDEIKDSLQGQLEIAEKAKNGVAELEAVARKRGASEEDIKALANRQLTLYEKIQLIKDLIFKADEHRTKELQKQTAELEKQAQSEKDSAQVENLKLKNQNKRADLLEAEIKYNQEKKSTQDQIDNAKSENEKQAYKDELKLLEDNYTLTKNQIDKKYKLEEDSYLNQLEIDALSLDEKTKLKADQLKIEDDYQKELADLNSKTEMSADKHAKAMALIVSKRTNALNALNDKELDSEKENRLNFVETFFDQKINKIQEDIDKAKANRAGSHIVDNLEKQKDELEKQKQIWKSIVESGGKFDIEMAQAHGYMKAMSLEQNRVYKAQKRVMDNLMRLAKAQNAYNQHLKIYNSLKAAGKDTTVIQKILVEDQYQIAGKTAEVNADAKRAGMTLDLSNTAGNTALLQQQEQQANLVKLTIEQVKQQIQDAIVGVGNAAGDLGREFFNRLTYWYPIILDATSQFVKLLSFILDPTKPKSPPITEVVAKGVDLIGKEYGRLDNIDLGEKLKANFSSLNYGTIPEINTSIVNPHIPQQSGRTITDTSTNNFNVYSNFDEQEMTRKLNTINRRRYTKVGL